MRKESASSYVSLAATLTIIVVASAACSPASSGTLGKNNNGGAGQQIGGNGGGVTVNLGAGGNSASTTGQGGTAGTGTTAEIWPPPGYTNVTDVSWGAYALGSLISGTGGGGGGAGGSGATSGGACSGLYGVVRDFKMSTTPGGHPDFQGDFPDNDPGIVKDTLDADEKPVYAHPGGTTPCTTGQANFDQWYHDTPGVNMTYIVGLHFVTNGNVLTFSASKNNPNGVPNSSFFPLDNAGFGNQDEPHNYSFTTEIHTKFTYNGGETFTFIGDDDVWVFINNRLAIDMGGLHQQQTQTVNLDDNAGKLGIAKGNVYSLAVFHAERHTVESNFRVDTTMAFTNCGEVNGQQIIP